MKLNYTATSFLFSALPHFRQFFPSLDCQSFLAHNIMTLKILCQRHLLSTHLSLSPHH